MKRKVAIILLALMALAVISACAKKTDEMVGEFKRSETVFVTGGLWDVPTSFSPISWDVPAGIRGFVYEPLMLYDNLNDRLIPWIAQSVEWQADGHTLLIKLNSGLRWSDGTPMTAEDIAFTFNYPCWSNPYEGAEATVIDANTVEVYFDDPAYHGIFLHVYTWPVLPKHIWENIDPDEATDLEVTLEMVVGSGPYTLEKKAEDRVVFLRDDNWWGINTLGRTFPAKRIVYYKSMANNVALASITDGRELDLANNFMPGLPNELRKNKNLHTWYNTEPFMLPDNVVFMMPNVTKAPWNDKEFRKAVYYAIDSEEVVDFAYDGMVTIPENALGFMDIPGWRPYNNKDLVAQYGYKFDPAKAIELLDRAGYTDRNGDGIREDLNGRPMELKISVPMGWSDWQDAIRVIADQLEAVGLNVIPDFPDEGRWQTDMVAGEFDCLINNWGSYVSTSPYTLYQWLYSSLTEIGEDEWTGNFGRYDNEELRDLIEEFARVPVTDKVRGNEIMRKIQKIHLDELPYFPLWINGMWYVANTSVWTNWPGDGSPNQNYPSMFIDKLQCGGLLMLSEIKLK